MVTRHSFAHRTAVLTLLATASVGPVLYPLWLAWRTRGAQDPVPPEPSEWPGVSVVVPAYREREVIGAKVENLTENGYPGPMEVIVVAEDDSTAAAARATKARVIADGARRGKARALNIGAAEATMPVLVLTDANALVERGGLEKLVRWLDDATVGAVAAEKRIGTEGFYWAFECWLKRREFRSGTTIGVDGQLLALRRADYVDLPGGLVVDDLWIALDVIEGGKRVAYEADIVVHEDGTETVGAEWERRTRVIAGTIDLLWRRRNLLVAGRSPVADQLWGHRLVRSSAGPLAHAALVAIALGSLRRSTLARMFVGIHALGLVAFVRAQRGADVGRAGRLLAQILFLQAAGVGGVIRWAAGDRPGLWAKQERVFRQSNATATKDVTPL